MSSERRQHHMKESKADRFRRVAEARVNKIIKVIRLLGNCSGTSVYAYTDAQVAYLFSASIRIGQSQKAVQKAIARKTSFFIGRYKRV